MTTGTETIGSLLRDATLVLTTKTQAHFLFFPHRARRLDPAIPVKFQPCGEVMNVSRQGRRTSPDTSYSLQEQLHGCFPLSGRISSCLVYYRRREEMAYVDGFVLAVPKEKIEEYKKLAERAGKVWKEHGALAFVECLADDVPYGELTSFPRAVQAKDDEIVVFSWIVYESRQERDRINKKVMADPRLKNEVVNMPFDGKRMIFGGFNTFLEL